MSEPVVEPIPVVQAVERYVSKELSAVEQYTNKELLDDDGVYGLHQLAARIYEMGVRDGRMTEAETYNYRIGRERNRQRAAVGGSGV